MRRAANDRKRGGAHLPERLRKGKGNALSSVVECAVRVHTKGHDGTTFGSSRKVRRSTTACIWQTTEKFEFARNRLADLLEKRLPRLFRTRCDPREVRTA